jgi:hypothetical protein
MWTGCQDGNNPLTAVRPQIQPCPAPALRPPRRRGRLPPQLAGPLPLRPAPPLHRRRLRLLRLLLLRVDTSPRNPLFLGAVRAVGAPPAVARCLPLVSVGWDLLLTRRARVA